MSRIARYCACGASLTGRVAPDQTAHELVGAWVLLHSGDGCAPATRAQAAAARRRADRKAASSRT